MLRYEPRAPRSLVEPEPEPERSLCVRSGRPRFEPQLIKDQNRSDKPTVRNRSAGTDLLGALAHWRKCSATDIYADAPNPIYLGIRSATDRTIRWTALVAGAELGLDLLHLRID